ncbi:MAG: TetR/AcrR family transcriptional regulator [Janthinobacterium lividum]
MTVARANLADVRLVTERPAPHERILRVARDLFCRHGIHATGIDRILSEASASKMTLYTRFGSKEALLKEVLNQEGAAQRGAIYAAMAAAGPDPVAQLLAVIDGLRGLFDGESFYGCAFMNAAAEHTKGTGAAPWLRAVAKAHRDELRDRMELLAGAAGYADPPLLARQVLLVMDGAIAALMVGGDPEVLTVASLTLQAVLGGQERPGEPPATEP